MMQKIKIQNTKMTLLLIALAGLAFFLALVPFRLVRAALPDLVITQGMVAASADATYSPSTTGPVTFNDNGPCPHIGRRV